MIFFIRQKTKTINNIKRSPSPYHVGFFGAQEKRMDIIFFPAKLFFF
jgi:hypothetical protein